MACFSNASEPGIEPPTQAEGCALLASQFVHNGEEEHRAVLDELIPMGQNGFAEKCKMFIPKGAP